MKKNKKYKVGFRHKHLKKLSDHNFGWGSLPQIYDNFQDAWAEKTRLEKENPNKGDYTVRLLFPYEYKEINYGNK